MARSDIVVDNRLLPASLRPRTHRNVSPSSFSMSLFVPSYVLLLTPSVNLSQQFRIPRILVNDRLTGFVWSLPVAFLLVLTGSILGESLLFLSFRHFLHDRIVLFRKEHEENYGTMVQVINQHKRWMVFLIRLSAIPV